MGPCCDETGYTSVALPVLLEDGGWPEAVVDPSVGCSAEGFFSVDMVRGVKGGVFFTRGSRAAFSVSLASLSEEESRAGGGFS